MRIVVTGAGEQAPAVLEDADNFREFCVVVPGEMEQIQVSEALREVGRLHENEHVSVRVESLKQLAGERATDADWLTSLDAMIDYAASHGWTDGDGNVRAHVERAGS